MNNLIDLIRRMRSSAADERPHEEMLDSQGWADASERWADALQEIVEGGGDRDALVAELLEALEAMLDDHVRIDPHHEHLCPLCIAASAAIAKAKS